MYSVGIPDRSKNDGMLDVGNSVGLGHDDDGDNDGDGDGLDDVVGDDDDDSDGVEGILLAK